MTRQHFEVRCPRIYFSSMNATSDGVLSRVLGASSRSHHDILFVVIVMLLIDRKRVLELQVYLRFTVT